MSERHRRRWRWSPAPRAASAGRSRWRSPRRAFAWWAPAPPRPARRAVTQALGAQAAPAGSRGVVLNVNDAAGGRRADRVHRQARRRHLHVLVNNAGVTRDQLAMRMKDDDWSAVMDTNLHAVFRLCRAVMRPMMKQRYGRIINITSVVGAAGNAGPGQLRRRQGRRGRPDARAGARTGQPQHHGQLRRARVHRHRHDRRPDRMRSARPCWRKCRWGVWAAPQDVAAAVAFLASPSAGYITGTATARQRRHVHGLSARVPPCDDIPPSSAKPVAQANCRSGHRWPTTGSPRARP